MQIIIHIGVHKTGTSALQYFLSNNRSRLSGRGIFYEPSAADHHSHTALAMAMHKDNPSQHEAAGKSFDDQIRRAVESKADYLLLSSEEFTGQRIDMTVMRSILRGHDVRVIAYMRSADELVASAFNQVVRESAIRRTEPIYSEPFAYDPSYSLPLDPWMEFMSPDQLMLAPYDRPQLFNGTIFHDFLHMLGLDGLAEFDFHVPTEHANHSMATPMIEQLRLFNRVALSNSEHHTLVDDLRTLERQNGSLCEQANRSLLTTAERCSLRRRTEVNLDKFRPFFRPGFDDRFLRSDTVQEIAPENVKKADPERDLGLLVLFQLLQFQQRKISDLKNQVDKLTEVVLKPSVTRSVD